jgi:hypothetical protein
LGYENAQRYGLGPSACPDRSVHRWAASGHPWSASDCARASDDNDNNNNNTGINAGTSDIDIDIDIDIDDSDNRAAVAANFATPRPARSSPRPR